MAFQSIYSHIMGNTEKEITTAFLEYISYHSMYITQGKIDFIVHYYFNRKDLLYINIKKFESIGLITIEKNTNGKCNILFTKKGQKYADLVLL